MKLWTTAGGGVCIDVSVRAAQDTEGGAGTTPSCSTTERARAKVSGGPTAKLRDASAPVSA